MRVDKLTKEQAARFGEWSRKCIEIGLSTEPADFEKATEAALKGYALANLKRPMVVLRMASPYGATVGGALACALLRELRVSEASVEQQVWQQVWQQVEQQVRQQVWQQVWQQVRQQVEQQVRQQVEQQVRQQVEQQGFKAAADGFSNYGINSLWSSWGAYISFFRDVCGWEDPVLERFAIDEALMKSCGWTWWHQNVLAISDRPEHIRRDDQGRLHSDVGMSIRYRDGWGHECVLGKAAEVRCVRKRIKFLFPNGEQSDLSGTCDSCIVIWRGHLLDFCKMVGGDSIKTQLRAA